MFANLNNLSHTQGHTSKLVKLLDTGCDFDVVCLAQSGYIFTNIMIRVQLARKHGHGESTRYSKFQLRDRLVLQNTRVTTNNVEKKKRVEGDKNNAKCSSNKRVSPHQ